MTKRKIQIMESGTSNKENLHNLPTSLKYDHKEGEVQDSTFKSSQKSKYFSSDKVTLNPSQEQKLKSSLPSLLDTYCKTSILDESDDFIHCDSRNKVCKKETNSKSNKTKNTLKSKRNESEIKTNKNELTCKAKDECLSQTSVTETEKSESLSTSDRKEILNCEICKEDITCLDVYNRSVHVNNCIDKQISNPPDQNAATAERTESESVFILECPLCFKHFPSPELRANHIKKCGKSKGLSTQSIIKAMELQERHALERISLGLPAKPIKPVKTNKNTAPKRTIVEPKNKAQSDIQLAKALSLSLANSQKQNEEENSSNITFVTLKPPTAEQHPGKKNKKIIATPLLVLRTEEERKKLLLDKVATIVSPQNISEDDSPMDVDEVLTDKKRENPNMLPLLWQLSGKASEKHDYYVENLLDWVQPSDAEVGAKFCHLSQIAGHEIVTQLPCEYTFSTQEEQSTCESAEHHDSPPSLIGSLQSLVASSWMSDVDIHTSCGTVIPAHRLLLAVRCPPLKKDLDFCSKVGRVSLKWESTNFDVALQFLNFIYTSSIEVEDSMKSDLLHLANKYEVTDLEKLLFISKKDKQPEVKSDERIIGDIGTKCSSFTKSYHYQSQLELEEGTCEMEEDTCETQEETNMDLDIVYNCINSSLKPSQPYFNKFLSQKAETSSQYMNEPENNSYGYMDLNCSQSESSRNSTQKCTVYSRASQGSQHSTPPMSEKVYSQERPTSPEIFDVNDSDNETEKNSDNESIELPASCSQKSNLKECHLEENDLDLCSTESNSSQDSVKFLQSSFPAHNNLPCTPLKEANFPASMSPKFSISPLKKESMSPINKVSRNLKKSVSECHEQVSEVFRFDEKFCPDNNHSTPVSKSPVFVNFIQSSPRSPESSRTYTTHQTEPSPSKLLDKDLAKDQSFLSKIEGPLQRTNFDEYESSIGGLKTPTKKSSVSCGNELSNPENFEHAENLCPLNESASPEILICDSDSNPKSPVSIPDDEVTCDNEKDEFPLSQRKFNFSEISLGSLKTSFQITPGKKLPGDILEQENNFNSQPSTFNDLANSPCSVSPVKRNIKSPVVICFSSDDEDEQLTTGSSSPKTVSLHDHECDQSKEKVSCTNLPSEEVKHSMDVGSSKSFSTSFEHYEDPPYEYDDYFEPNISSPVKPDECFESNVFSSAKAGGYFEPNISSPVKPKVSDVTPPRKMANVKENNKSKTVTPTSVTDPKFRLSDSPITPFPDYKNMDTPGIKEALQRIGVKALPRKKALELLKHVYNETHPLVNGNIENDSPERVSKTEKVKKRKKLKEDAKPSKRKQVEANSPEKFRKPIEVNSSEKFRKPAEANSSEKFRKPVEVSSPEKFSATQESDDSGSENPEWQGCVPEISFTQCTQDSPSKATKDDLDLIKQYIQSNEELYSNVLTYTPLNLVAFHQELKDNGIKISIQKLMDFFDEQCITFTCPRKEEYKKKQTARAQKFRKRMIAKLSQQTT